MDITKLKLFPNLAHELTILKAKVAWGEHFSNIQHFRVWKKRFKNTFCLHNTILKTVIVLDYWISDSIR